MKKEDLKHFIELMKKKIKGDPETLFLLNIIVSFFDPNEEEFKDLIEESERFLDRKR